MDINSELMNRHSEDEFAAQLRVVADAGAGVIHIRCTEVMRAIMSLRKALLLDGNTYNEWDIVTGFKSFNTENMYALNVQGDSNANMLEAYGAAQKALTNPTGPDPVVKENERRPLTFFAYVNPHFWVERNPVITQLTLYYASILPSTDYRILLITPDITLPDQFISESTYTIRFNPPGLGELRESMDAILSSIEGDDSNIDEEDRERICYIGAGMAKDQFDMSVALAAVKAIEKGEPITTEAISTGVAEGKTEVVKKTDLLELYRPEDMDNVGGMDNLKEWVYKRRDCYSDEAREFGIEPPKGIVLAGIPGSGKSLVAKAISKTLGVPLIRLDFGRVFNALVGASEERMRYALRLVESMSPAVLLCDEVDKGLGGIGGSNDSGTSSRVLGSFLTWLQDCQYPVFVVMTANNVMALPPELMRRGRFDAIFSTGLPTEDERAEVLRIHLRKRGYEKLKFTATEQTQFAEVSKGYVPAEIESAVKDALVEAFNDEKNIDMNYIISALTAMIPLSKAFNDEIQLMTAWAQDNAIPASKATIKARKGSPAPTSAPHRRTRSSVPPRRLN